MSTKQAHEQRQAKILLRPMHLVGMLQLSLDAALLEGTCDFILKNLFLTDLPAAAASKYTLTQGSLNKNSIEIMKVISYRGKMWEIFFQCLQIWGFLNILTVWDFWLYFFAFSLNIFPYRLFSISSSTYL